MKFIGNALLFLLAITLFVVGAVVILLAIANKIAIGYIALGILSLVAGIFLYYQSRKNKGK